MLGRLLPGTVPFGFMLLLDHVGSHRLDTLAIGARLFSFLLDVPILALFFFADPSHMFLLGYRALLARMEHLFRQPRCHTPSSEQSLCRALQHRQPPHRYQHPAVALAAVAPVFPHACPHNFFCRRSFAIKMRALALTMRVLDELPRAREAALLGPYGLALSTYYRTSTLQGAWAHTGLPRVYPCSP